MASPLGFTPTARTYTAELAMDLVNSALDDLGPGKLEVVLTHAGYHILDRLIPDRVEETSGTGLSEAIQLEAGGNARFVSIGEADQVGISDNTSRWRMDWRYLSTYYAFYLQEEAMNSGPAKLFDLVESRRNAEIIGFADTAENAFWTYPTDPDAKDFWGIPAFVCKATAATSGGFYGGRPDGGTLWSSVAGIVPCTSGDGASTIAGGERNWRNYCATWSAMDETLMKRISRAMLKTRFEAPQLTNLRESMSKSDLRIFTGTETLVDMRSMARKNNDNLGADLLAFEGNTLINRSPVIHVDQLDGDTSYPIYGINLDKWKFRVLRGWNIRESKASKMANNHNGVVVFIDLAANLACFNRKTQWVINQV